MAVIVKNRKTGKSITLLNPSEKGGKFADELRTGVALTNDGEFKKGSNGEEFKVLTDKQRAYRSGYLAARKDNARAYKAKQKRKNKD